MCAKAVVETAAVKTDKEELFAVLASRVSNYRMLSRLFLRPLNQEEIDSLASIDMTAMAKNMGNAGLLGKGFNDMGRGLHRRHTGTQRLLSTDFTMCFDGISTLHGERAVPYASIFIGSKTGDKAELFQEPRNADRAVYRSEQIEIDPSLHLPDDHLSFELSFMADLSEKIAEALRNDDIKEARRLVEVSENFRTGHILSWYGKLFDLASQIVETRFYHGVLNATYGYLELDGDTLNDIKLALR
jgi:TorA maturation chaperone TorD